MGVMDFFKSLRGMNGMGGAMANPFMQGGQGGGNLTNRDGMSPFMMNMSGAPQAQPSGVAGFFGKPINSGMGTEDGGLSRKEFMALALSQIGDTYGPNPGNNQMGSAIMQQAQTRGKEAKAASLREQTAEALKAAGYDQKTIAAAQFLPESALKEILSQAAPYTLSEGQQRRSGTNELLADAPKYSVANDTILKQSAGGIENAGTVAPSYADTTGRINANKAPSGGEQWRILPPDEAKQMGLPGGVTFKQSNRGDVQPVTPRGAIQLTGSDKKLMDDVRGAANTARSLKGQADIFAGANDRGASYPGSGFFGALSPETATMNQTSSMMRGFMRPAGSGATSDYEQRLYAQGAPSVDRMENQNDAMVGNIQKLADIAQARQFFYEDYSAQNGSLNGAERAFQGSPDFQSLTMDSAPRGTNAPGAKPDPLGLRR